MRAPSFVAVRMKVVESPLKRLLAALTRCAMTNQCRFPKLPRNEKQCYDRFHHSVCRAKMFVLVCVRVIRCVRFPPLAVRNSSYEGGSLDTLRRHVPQNLKNQQNDRVNSFGKLKSPRRVVVTREPSAKIFCLSADSRFS